MKQIYCIFVLFCFIECDIGYFGYNCAESCGHCIDQVQCSRVDGACPTGCSAGFSGRLCQKGDKRLIPCIRTCTCITKITH